MARILLLPILVIGNKRKGRPSHGLPFHTNCRDTVRYGPFFIEQLVAISCIRSRVQTTEAESDIPVHVRVHVHEGKISGLGLRYQGVVRVWSQDGGS